MENKVKEVISKLDYKGVLIYYNEETKRFQYQNERYRNYPHLNFTDIVNKECIKKLGLKYTRLNQLSNNTQHYKYFTNIFSKVLVPLFRYAIEDCIENGHIFKLGTLDSYLKLENDNSLTKQRLNSNGTVYADIDLLESDFSIYRFTLTTPYIKYEVRISYDIYKKIVKKTNEGSKFESFITKRPKDYLEQLEKDLPIYTKDEIKLIIETFFTELNYYFQLKKNFRFEFAPKAFILKIYNNEESISK